MFGYAAAEIVGQRADILVTPEDRAAGVPEQELATARAAGRASDERWHLRKDGSRFYCSGVTTRLGGGNGFAKIARDLTERQQAQVQLAAARAELENRVKRRTSELESQLRRWAAARKRISTVLRRVVSAQEEERARIARDLHDQLGQQLTALRLALEQYGLRCGGADDLTRSLELVQAIDRELDFLAWELRPAALDDFGLSAALPRYVAEWSTHYGATANFRGSGPASGALSATAETAFYRVAQEALTNVSKHA